MCEWLNQDEWCDVELYCAGRTFSAHRAVLASVSPFLRQLLVTSTGEDGRIFIILPEFDVDALTSVLYYIYNGEVMIQKAKLKMFFDLIDAMNIFIDLHHTGKLVTKDEPALLSTTNVERKIKDLYVLRSENDNKSKNILIKKGQTLQNIKAQCYFKESDNVDIRIWGEHTKPRLASLKPYEDRQRNYFSSDSFIEAYPQNGNGNGLRAAVPAISNATYRALTSLSLVNTNSKYLDGSLSDASGKTLSKSPYCSTKENISNYSDNLYFRRLNLIYEDIKNNVTHLEFSSVPIVKSKFDLSVTKVSSSFNYNEIRRVTEKEAQLGTRFRTQIIQNKALDSPWSFRIPVDYYKPKKKHAPTSNCMRNTQTNLDFFSSEILMDNNNNMKSSPVTNVTGNLEAIEKCQLQSTQSITMPASEFKCTVCEQVFQSADSLLDHKRCHGSPSRFTCSECGKTFSQPRNFKYHMSVHRGTKEYAASCMICGKNFNDRGYLSSHMKIHRNRKEYKCSLCPKSFNQRVAYNMHVRIHTGVKPHVCEECGKAFSRKMLLKQHRRTHSGERPHACPRCDRRFADRSNMTLHLRLHTGVKPFSCSMCDKAFTKKHHLKAHINSHTGAKPYSCPRCTLAFTQSSNMRTHYKKCCTQTATTENLH